MAMQNAIGNKIAMRKMPMGSYESNLGHGFGPLRAMGHFEDRVVFALTRGRSTAAFKRETPQS